MELENLPEPLRRRLLFTPVGSREALHDWIATFLGLDLPGTIVDPESNSTPMDLCWEIYSKAIRNDDPRFSRILGYAAREAMKTLVAAVLEVLCIFHLGRSFAHMAAIEAR